MYYFLYNHSSPIIEEYTNLLLLCSFVGLVTFTSKLLNSYLNSTVLLVNILAISNSALCIKDSIVVYYSD